MSIILLKLSHFFFSSSMLLRFIKFSKGQRELQLEEVTWSVSASCHPNCCRRWCRRPAPRSCRQWRNWTWISPRLALGSNLSVYSNLLVTVIFHSLLFLFSSLFLMPDRSTDRFTNFCGAYPYLPCNIFLRSFTRTNDLLHQVIFAYFLLMLNHLLLRSKVSSPNVWYSVM